MTTEARTSSRRPRPYGVPALGAAVLPASVIGAATAVLGLLLDGSAGLLGALVGAGVTLLVLSTGFVVVDLVAGLMPAASLIVALLTYTLQLVLLAVLLLALSGIDGGGETLSPAWFAGGVMVVALAWTVCLVGHAMRARIPLYDLPEQPANGAGSRTATGSER